MATKPEERDWKADYFAVDCALDGFLGTVEVVCDEIRETRGELDVILSDALNTLNLAVRELRKSGAYPRRPELSPEALSILRGAMEHHGTLIMWDDAFAILRAIGADTEEDRANHAKWKEFADEIEAGIQKQVTEEMGDD